MGDLGSVALGYGAGALSTLSPCVLPLLPIVLLGAVERHAWGPMALAAGLSFSFASVGIAIASIGFTVGIDPSVLRSVVAALLVAFGAALLLRSLQARLALIAGPIAAGGQTLLDRFTPSGVGGQFVVGALLGAVWSPCSGPTLGAAVGLASQSGTIVAAAAVMLAFGLGAATPILALAYGSRQSLFARRDTLMRLSRFSRPIMGWALVSVGLFVLTGLDKLVETTLTRAMPDWLVAVTTRL